MKIWKYPLKLIDLQTIDFPVNSKILTAQVQNNVVCIWALCDETEPKISRNIAIYGTGTPISDNPGKYISTFQLYNGSVIFHVFEIG